MKIKLLCAAMLVASLTVSCDYDDSEIKDQLADHEEQLDGLDDKQESMTNEIEALKALTAALEGKDSVTGVEPITEDGKTVGYTISFEKGEDIKITNGKDGKDGEDGEDGEDGADGAAGAAGDSFFESVEYNEVAGIVTITLKDKDPFTLSIGNKLVETNVAGNILDDDELILKTTSNKASFNFTLAGEYRAVAAEVVSGDILTKGPSVNPATVLVDKVELTAMSGVFTATISNSGGGNLTPGKTGIIKITVITNDGSEVSTNIIYTILDANTTVVSAVAADGKTVDQVVGDAIATAITDSQSGSDAQTVRIIVPEGTKLEDPIELDASELTTNNVTIDFGNYTTDEGEAIQIVNTADQTSGSSAELIINAPNATVELKGDNKYGNVVARTGNALRVSCVVGEIVAEKGSVVVMDGATVDKITAAEGDITIPANVTVTELTLKNTQADGDLYVFNKGTITTLNVNTSVKVNITNNLSGTITDMSTNNTTESEVYYKGTLPTGTVGDFKVFNYTPSVDMDGVIAANVCKDKAYINEITIPAPTPDGSVVFEGTKVIGEKAFYGTSITTITVPASVEKMGHAVFGSCTSLTSVTMEPVNAPTSVDGSTGNDLFDDIKEEQSITVTVPVGSKTTYKNEGKLWKSTLYAHDALSTEGEVTIVDATSAPAN